MRPRSKMMCRCRSSIVGAVCTVSLSTALGPCPRTPSSWTQMEYLSIYADESGDFQFAEMDITPGRNIDLVLFRSWMLGA